MGETILVTGSTGFIGTRLLHQLAAEGERVRIFLRIESQSGSLPEGVDVVRGSFSDMEALGQAVSGVDRIIHLAGVTKALNEVGYDAGNVVPVQNLLAAVMKYNSDLKRFLLISSLAAAGSASDGVQGVTERDIPHPVSAYGRSKLRAETLCMESSAQIPVTIVRPPAVYGPGDKDIFQVFMMMAKGLLITPGSVAKQRFSMIYVDDLVSGIMRAARSDCAIGHLYYITSPVAYSWDDVISAAKPVLGIRKIFKVSLPRAFVFIAGAVAGVAGSLSGKPALINGDKVHELVENYWVCSPVRAEQELGFTASTTLAGGVASTISWYRHKGWI